MAGLEARSYCELILALDPSEAAFVERYLECRNGAEAARHAWPNNSRGKQKSYGVMQRPDVRAAIDAGLRERR